MADQNPFPAFPESDARRELARILASHEFQSSSQLSDFLRYVVEQELLGHGEQIKERNIAITALGRESDFDPRLDCIVRVAAGRLRRALERFYAGEKTPSSIRIEVPKGTYRPVIRRVALPDNSPLATDASQLNGTSDDVCPMGYPTVAVLPFVTFTQGERERYMGDSLAEDIAVRLSKFSWFQVIDYLAARSLQNERYIPHEIAAKLHAEYFLAGTVRRQSSHDFRVTVQMTHTDDAVIVWAEEFDVHGSEIDQGRLDSVADRVVVSVGDIFGVLADAVWSKARRKPIAEMTAVEAVLLQMQYESTFDEENFTATYSAAERAVRDNPEFAWAWSALAALHNGDAGLLANGGIADAPQRSRDCFQRALKIDPTCAYAHWCEAVHHLFLGRAEEAIDTAQRTLDHANGSPFIIGAVGALLNVTGEVRQGQQLIDEALAVNPRLPGWVHWGTSIGQLANGDYDAALATAERFSMPQNFWDHILRVPALVRTGRKTEAAAALRTARRLRPELANNTRDLVSKIVVDSHCQDDILDGLQAAGAAV